MRTLPLAALLAPLLAASSGLAQASRPSVHVLSSSEVTAARRPVFSGIADPGRVVVLSLDGALLGRVPVGATGSWSFVTPADLGEGRHLFGAWVDGTDPLGAGAFVRDLSVVACAASSDCGGATPVCDAGRCVACAGDDACGFDPGRPVCSRRGATEGMCVSPPPEVTSPAPGHAVGPSRRVAEGRARPFAGVAVLVDGREVGRATADASGAFAYELPALARAWHQVSAAHLEEGLTGVEGEGSRFLAAECVTDADCGAARRCELPRFVCVERR